MSEEVYSIDNEIFHDCQATVIDMALDNQQNFIYVGLTKEISHSDFLNIDYLIETMRENAYSEYAELAENYLNITGDQMTELKKIIVDYLDLKVKIGFYKVVDVEKVGLKEMMR